MRDVLEHQARRLPTPVKWALKRGYGLVDPLEIRRFRRDADWGHPIPPGRLRLRVGAGARVRAFVLEGRRTLGQFLRAYEERVDPAGITAPRTWLDWGCGCGRLTTHMLRRRGPQTRILGCDVDRVAIEWCHEHLSDGEFAVSGPLPPLPYETGEVDVVVASSVFTHLSPDATRAWAEELHRVLPAGGILLASIAGEAALESARSGEMASHQREFRARCQALGGFAEEGGSIFVPYEVDRWNRADLDNVGQVYGMTFIDVAWLRDAWSDWFEVLEHLPATVNVNQDIVVLRRR